MGFCEEAQRLALSDESEAGNLHAYAMQRKNWCEVQLARVKEGRLTCGAMEQRMNRLLKVNGFFCQ